MHLCACLCCVLIEDGTLYYRKSGRTQKVVTTKKERDSVLQSAHLGQVDADTGSHADIGSHADTSSHADTGSHVDSDAMLAAIEPHYKWTDIKLDIDDWVCHVYVCVS